MMNQSEIQGREVTPTNASNSTQNYNLPLFTGEDEPSWLVDFNGAMDKIDAGMQANKEQIDANDDTLKTTQDRVQKLETESENHSESIENLNTVTTEHTQQISDMNSEIDTIQNDLITQNTAVKQAQTDISTLKNDVGSAGTSIGTLTEQVNTLNTSVATANDEINELTGEVSDIDKTLNTNSIKVDALLKRVCDVNTINELITGSASGTTVEISNASGVAFPENGDKGFILIQIYSPTYAGLSFTYTLDIPLKNSSSHAYIPVFPYDGSTVSTPRVFEVSVVRKNNSNNTLSITFSPSAPVGGSLYAIISLVCSRYTY